MKHVRLMIFSNWISQKAGDKVPHTPLILPISTAGLKHALLCRWIWSKGREWSVKRGRTQGSQMKRGVDCAMTAPGRTVAEVVPVRPNARGLITISVLGVRRVRGGRAPGRAANQNEEHRVRHVRPQRQTFKLLLSEVVWSPAFTTNRAD